MKIYIDFDGTLFNTDKYKEDIINILNDYGIDKMIFEEVKKIFYINNKVFDIIDVVDYFIDKYNIDNSLKDKINGLLNNSYIYSDVIENLKILLDMGYELYLLTYGHQNYQRKKINSSNIFDYFKDIIITEKDKSKLDIDYENSIFIDNNPIEIKRFHNSNAKKIIRIIRENEKYSKEVCNVLNVIECNSFYHIVEILRGDFINE